MSEPKVSDLLAVVGRLCNLLHTSCIGDNYYLYICCINDKFCQMLQTIPIIAGIFASMLHVISGPDHLAAVTPLVLEKDRQVWKIGLFWGLGHLAGMLLIGFLFILLKDNIPVDAISSHSEFLVGFVLIGIGLWSFYRIYKFKKIHKHPHIHLGDKKYIHIHQHGHTHEHSHTHSHDNIKSHDSKTSFGIGFIHGLAGVAHFLLLLPVLGFNNKLQGLQYIFGFAIGTVLAMVLYTLILGKVSQSVKKTKNKKAITSIQIVGGLFAIIIGIYWIFSN